MGTVGISFGSPTSGQGFNVSSTVSAITANLSAIETPWNTQLTALEAQDTALTSIGSDMSTLANALQNLTAAGGALSTLAGSSSDNSVVEITGATTGAVAGSHTITVNNLATTSSYFSSAVGSSDTLSGTLSISIDGGKTQTLSVDGDTLSQVETAINGGNYGVTANVETTASGSVLTLDSSTSGAAGEISLTGSSITDTTTGNSAVSFTQSQAGQDASLIVDGVSITSGSNTVTNAITGVTLQLLSASPTASGSTTPEQVQVEIVNDNSGVESAIGSFVSAYNAVMGDLNAQEGNDASGNPEPLDGSPTVAAIQEQLQQALTFVQASGGVTSLTQLGVTANSDGTLSLDGDALSSELDNNYQDVVNFFQSDSSFTSFGDNLTDALNNLAGTGSSTDTINENNILSLALQQNSSQESVLNTDISNENIAISTQESQLTTELNQANFTLEEIPEQLQSVNELYSAITGFNEDPQG